MNLAQHDFIYQLGYQYLQHGKVDKALTLFSALEAIGDQRPKVFQAISFCLMQTGQYQSALDYAEESIAHSNRKTVRPCMQLKAQILFHLGRTSESQEIMHSIKG